MKHDFAVFLHKLSTVHCQGKGRQVTIVQSVQNQTTHWTGDKWRFGFHSPQLPVRFWAPSRLLFNGYRERSTEGKMTLTNLLHLVPILRMSEVITSIPPTRLHPLNGDGFEPVSSNVTYNSFLFIQQINIFTHREQPWVFSVQLQD